MVKRFTSAFGSFDSDIKVFPYPGLTDKIVKIFRPQAAVQRGILFIVFTGNNTFYINAPCLLSAYYNIYYTNTSQHLP
jgi:hypothetical protein